LERAAQVLNAPRFTLLYRSWLKHGDALFGPVSSPFSQTGWRVGPAA
jgi:hypothetical protein